MSEVLQILGEMVPDSAVRSRVIAHLASPDGDRLLAEIDLEIRRRIGSLVARVATELAQELAKANAEAAAARAIALEQVREVLELRRSQDGAAEFEAELATLSPSERAVTRECIEAAITGRPNQFPPEDSSGGC